MSNLAGYGRAKAKMPSKFKFLSVDMKNVMVVSMCSDNNGTIVFFEQGKKCFS